MTKAKLTDLSVQRLGEGLYFDEKTPGFGLRIGKNRRTWIAVKGEKRTQLRLGHYPAMTLSEARKRALVTLGSPMQDKTRVSFEEAKEAFLGLGRWRPQSLRVLTSNLRHFTWRRTLDKITHEDVATALDAIEGKSARAHALKDIRTFFNWCVPRYLPSSPCTGLKMDAQPSRDRILSNDELKAIWNACEGTFGTIVKLLLLTGQRKMEIGSLMFNQIKGDLVELPPQVTKNGRFHQFPIGPIARSLLPQHKGYLFRATGSEDVYNGYTFHLKQLQKASGTTGWVLHDLRRSYVSALAQLGIAPHVISALINHVSEGLSPIQRVYNRHSYLPEMRAACERYEAHIQSICQG